MKKLLAFILAFALCLSLWACGGSPAPAVKPTTEPTTEPVPDIQVFAKVPGDWSDIGCWAWEDGGADAFDAWPGETMVQGGEWSWVYVPGWADHLIINGNGGTVQTADLPMEPGVNVWVHVVNADYAYVYYEEPSQEQLVADLARPAQEYHEAVESVLFRGGYQITGLKAVTYNERTSFYSTDYIPEELQAEDPREIYYVINLENKDKFVGYYFGVGGTTAAVQPGVAVQIMELATGKVLAQSETFVGGEPPQSIPHGHDGRGEEPDAAEIEAWIHAALEDIQKNPPVEMPEVALNEEDVTAEMPEIPLNEDALTEEEKAALEAKELAERLHLSYSRLVEWLVEYEDYTQEEAETAAANCNVDWAEMACLEAQELLGDQPDDYNGFCSYTYMLHWLTDVTGFTEEQAQNAADSCSVDWNAQALLQAQWMLDDEDGFGYSKKTLKYWLTESPDMGGYGFTQEQASYAMEKCVADWAEQAVKAAKNMIEYSAHTYKKEELIQDLIQIDGFTKEDATYAAESLGLK